MMTKTFEHGKDEIARLCDYFARNRDAFLAPGVKEDHVRQNLVDPFFEALGWDVHNRGMAAPQYREVVSEDSLDVEGHQKAPDYTFRVGTLKKFYAEAKKCGVNLNTDPRPAYQLRTYGFSSKLAVSILTDFEELGVYDCTTRPKPSDKASHARILYLGYQEYPDRWRELWDVFSREAVWSGAFDQYAASKRKRGTTEVDDEFLKDIESWREELARNIALRNRGLSPDDLNRAVQLTIDRVVFLRMGEDRGLEPYEQILKLCERPGIYSRFMGDLCRKADEKYNSGLFHFQKEPGVDEDPDRITPRLVVDDKVFKPILEGLYFEHGSPYQFSVLPVEILGTVYERFLGKVIRLTPDHRAKVEEKPEVRKAGGVYYTPAYIVDYIVQQTVARQIEGRSPMQLAGLRNGKQPFRVLDMACGSGSFLLGAYQCLLDHCLKWYEEHNPQKHKKAVYRNSRANHWRLTIQEKKRILTTHVFGVDIDAQAAEVTKLSLLLKVLEGESDQTVGQTMQLFHERALPNLENNIKCGNSLIGSDYFTGRLITKSDEIEMQQVNPFDWGRGFPDAMEAEGFDCVIGNPPYVRPHNIDPGVKEYLWTHYTTFVRKSDLYCAFIERAIQLLRPRGQFGFIISDGWLRLDSFEQLRHLLLSGTAIHQIIDFDGEVFAEASVRTAILIFSKGQKGGQKVRVATIKPTEQLDTIPTRKIAQKLFSQQYKSIFDLSLDESTDTVKAKMRAFGKTIGDCFEISFGLKTGDDSVFLAPSKRTSQHKPLLRGEDVHRYALQFKGEYVWYVPERMTAHRRTARPGTANRFEQPKVLVRDTGGGLQAVLEDEEFYVKDVLILSHPGKDKSELAFLTGLLNSRLMRFYYETSFPTLHVQRNELASLPLRPIAPNRKADQKNRNRLVSLVEGMLSLHRQLISARADAQKAVIQRQVNATDGEIDRLVYRLYGLSKMEIAVVETTTS